MGSKIIGRYEDGRFALVNGKTQQDRLKSLGNFGTDTAQASRKQTNRRGPHDKDISEIQSSQLEEEDGTVTALSLSETFFLVHALGCLELVDNGHQLSALSCWNLFRNFYDTSHQTLDFAIEYGVYHFLRSRGWVVKGGENYGASFLLYQKGPSIDHARYAVIIVPAEASDCKWNSLLTYNRVIQGVSKELLIAYVSIPKDFQVSRENPSCIREMTIQFYTFASRTNHIDKDNM